MPVEEGDSEEVKEKDFKEFSGHEGGVECVAYFPDGQHIVTGGTDKTAGVVNVETMEEVCVLKGHEDQVNYVAVLDNRMVVS